jgi:hypothetical protein
MLENMHAKCKPPAFGPQGGAPIIEAMREVIDLDETMLAQADRSRSPELYVLWSTVWSMEDMTSTDNSYFAASIRRPSSIRWNRRDLRDIFEPTP